MSPYLPKCCFVRADGAGGYEVCHTEASPKCRHGESGNGRPCNRIIGKGRTRRDAREDARENLDR